MTCPIDTQAALDGAVARLVARDPVWNDLLTSGANPALRRREPGFAGLASIVVGQQVSVHSAAAIWARLRLAYPALTPEAVLAGSDEPMRTAGLSRPKVAALRSIAAAIVTDRLPLAHLGQLPAEDAHDALVAVGGIGPWTADVYLLFCLGHPDAFPAGDLALQEAARMAFALPARPNARALAALADRWRPERGAAAYLLWGLYRQRTRRDVAPAP